MSGNLDIGPLQSGNPDIGPLQSSGATPQITIAVGIPSAEAFGCGLQVNVDGNQGITICGGGIPSAEAFGAGISLAVAPNITLQAGIPSAEAFGLGLTLTTSPGIAIQYGIPSSEVMGVPTLLTRDFQVFLAGKDVTDLLIAVGFGSGAPTGQTKGSVLTLTDPLTGPSTASCTLRDPSGTLHPSVGQQFLFYHLGVRIFGGTIEEPAETAFQALKSIVINLKANDFSTLFDRRVVGAYYSEATGGSLSAIVSDVIQTWLAGDGVQYSGIDGDPGVQLGPLTFNWIYVRALFNQLGASTNWDYRVDPYGVLRFFPHATGIGSAPFAIQDNDGNWLAESLSTRTYRGQYANRIYGVSNTQSIALWCDIFSAAHPGPFRSSKQPPDGVRTVFITLYAITKTPQVTLNTNPQIVKSLTQIAGHVADGTIPYDWYWVDPNGFGVFQNPTHAPLTASDVLEVCYPSQVPPVITVQDDSQIAARAAIEGTSGIYDMVVQLRDITDPVAIAAYLDGLLTRFGRSGMPREITYSTDRDGLKVGQLQRINTSNPFVPDAEYLITNLVTTDYDKTFLRYQVTATSGANQSDNYVAFFQALTRGIQQTAPSNREMFSWNIAPSYAGITNPGIQGGIQQQAYIVQAASALLQFVTVYCQSAPQGEGWIIDILINTNGTLGNSFVLPAGAQGPVTAFFQNPTRVFAGDIVQVLLRRSSNASLGKDMVITLTASVSL